MGLLHAKNEILDKKTVFLHQRITSMAVCAGRYADMVFDMRPKAKSAWNADLFWR